MRRLALLVLIVTACDREPGFVIEYDGPLPVVQNYSPEWNGSPEWHVSPNPMLSIPQWSAPKARDSAHIVDAKQLPDGTIAIANGFTGEIGLFTHRARLLQRFGGKGLEAGRFQTLRSLHVIDDAIWAFDQMGRWNVFDLQGSLLSTAYMEPLGRPWSRVEPYGDEMAILASSGSPGPGTAAGQVRGSASLLRYELSGEAIDTLRVVPGQEFYVEAHENGRSIWMHPFGSRPVIHGGRDLLYYGSGDDMLVRVYRDGRSLERMMGIPAMDLTITDEEWARWDEWLRERIDEGRSLPLDAVPRRETRPAYERFVEDALGNLWVAEFSPAFLDPQLLPSNSWTVFDPHGRWLGTIETPPGLMVTEIGEDYVLGIRRTEGRSVVHRYGLTR